MFPPFSYLNINYYNKRIPIQAQEGRSRNGVARAMGSKLSGRQSVRYCNRLIAKTTEPLEIEEKGGYHPSREVFVEIVILSRLLHSLMEQLSRSNDEKLTRMTYEVRQRYLAAVSAARTKYWR